jgi:hypothetical protein
MVGGWKQGSAAEWGNSFECHFMSAQAQAVQLQISQSGGLRQRSNCSVRWVLMHRQTAATSAIMESIDSVWIIEGCVCDYLERARAHRMHCNPISLAATAEAFHLFPSQENAD